MTDGNAYPPPGSSYPPPGAPGPAQPAPGTPPPYAPPPPPGYPPYPPAGQAPLHHGRPVYKPGTIPLRPLTLSDIFSGSIETIRRNPKATLGIAALVLTGFLAIPMLGTVIWGLAAGFGSELSTSDEFDGTEPGDIGLLITLYGGTLLSLLATVVLGGMIVHVVEHAARGQKLAAGAAWRLTRSRVWRLVVLSILSILVPVLITAVVIVMIVIAAVSSTGLGIGVGIVASLGGLAAIVYLYVRLFLLAPASLVIESRGVFSAMGRSWALTRGQFWRVFGIGALSLLVTSIAGYMIALPFSIIGFVAVAIWPDVLGGVLVMMLTQNIAQVLSGALTTPFSAGVSALQYVDQRIRKEGYDIALIAQLPGTVPATGPYPSPYGAPQPPPPPQAAPPYGGPTAPPPGWTG